MSEEFVQAGIVKMQITLRFKKKDGTIEDISTASVKKVKIRQPGGTVLERNGVFVTTGSDGLLRYTTVLDDVPATKFGWYKVQGYVELSDGFKGHSTIVSFEAKKNLS